MIYNYDQLIKQNLKLYDAFIDLKVTGWKTYSKAVNEYTQGFFKAQLEKSDESVEKIGTNFGNLNTHNTGELK